MKIFVKICTFNLHHFAKTKSSYSISLNVQHHMKVCNEKYLYAEKLKKI